MENFKLFGGKLIEDATLYTIEYIQKHPNVNVYVGTDSDDNNGRTVHASTICFEHPGKGVHIIFKRTYLKKFKLEELNLKLMKEVELSLEVANELREAFIEHEIQKTITVDCDVNPNSLHNSNCAYNTTTGWVVGSGYKVRTKPEAWAASRAADLLCK